MNAYWKTIQITSRTRLNGGVIYLLPDLLLRLAALVPLLFLWRGLLSQGSEDGMTLQQMLTYTYVSALFADLMVIKSPLTDWLYNGLVISLYARPLNLYGQVIAQTLGTALPALLCFSLPMAALSPLFGVSLIPASLWFMPSLALCVSLGFALDFLFACMLIRMMNSRWLVFVIRNAVTVLFSGSVLPFAALPWGLGRFLALQPFGSLGGAPLALYTGLSEPQSVIPLQILWNLILWPLAIAAFQKSRERLVSHGG